MNNISINDIFYNYIIDTSFVKISQVAVPDWITQDPEIDDDVWTKKLLIIVYTLRVTDAEKWVLDQLLTAHQQVFIEDDTYNIYASTWVRNINSTWEGHIDYDNPWLLEIELVVVSLLEGDYSSWAIYDSFDETNTSAGIDVALAFFNRIETIVMLSDAGQHMRPYTIATKTLGTLLTLGQYQAYDRRITSSYGTYLVVFNSSNIYIFKNGIQVQTITDTDLGLNDIDCIHISPKGKYIAISGNRITSGNNGWVILVGS